MICQKCGSEAQEGAVFCNRCGYRLDEKRACLSCEKMNEKESAYCIYCGARMDGKTVCKNCNTAHEGNFCPNCGRSAGLKKIPFKEEISVAYDEPKKDRGFVKAVDIGAQIFGGIGLLLAVIFTFLIGFSCEGTALGFESEEVFWIYRYFGKAYEYLEPMGNGVAKSAMLFGLILCTIIAVGTFIYVGVAGIISTYGYLSKLTGEKKAFSEKWLLRGIVGFLFGVFGIYSVTMVRCQIEGIELAVKLNTVTKIGVILCVICAGLYVLLKQISSWGSPNERKICVWIGSVISIAVLVVVFCLLVFSGVAMNIQSEGITGKLGISYIYFLMFLDGIFSPGELDSVFSLGIMEQILSIMLILSVLATIVESVNCAQEKQKIDWLLAAVVFTTALLFMIFSFCVSSQASAVLKEFFGGETQISVTFSNVQAILIFVFSAINLAVTVIGAGVENYYWKKDFKKRDWLGNL